MVHVFLNQETYNPGDELRVALTPSRSDRIQLLSVRCVGYIRVPVAFARDSVNRSKYEFKDKPIGPILPDDSVLLWVTPNFPVHVSVNSGNESLVKVFIPYFLPPSLRGGLFEICHYLEVSVLNKGEFDIRTKKIPLAISSLVHMPKLVSPAVGDGYEQIDFSLPPAHQSTPHGKRCSAWEAVDLIRRKSVRRTVSGIFKSRRGFRISFNNQQAMEIVTHGEWLNDRMLIEDGTAVNVHYRFEESGVSVRRVIVRLIRIELISGHSDFFHDSCVAESVPLIVSQCSVETAHTIAVPRLTCPSFSSDLPCVEYRLDFEIRAVDAITEAILEPVVWSLPVDIVPFDLDISSQTDFSALPVIPFGAISPLEKWKDFEYTFPHPSEQMSMQQSEIEAVKFASLLQPGSMRFTILS